jgi:hypothetical protein
MMKAEGIMSYKKNPRMYVLDKAYEMFIEMIKEYASKHNLSEKEERELLHAAYHAYNDKKTTYFIEDKLSKFSLALDLSARFAVKQLKGELIK